MTRLLQAQICHKIRRISIELMPFYAQFSYDNYDLSQLWQCGRRCASTITLVAILLGLLTAFSPAAAVDVTGIRAGSHLKHTRLVIELSESVKFKVITLGRPDRVVIDLPDIAWKILPGSLPRKVGMIKRLRYGQFRRGQSRVVLDVIGPARVKGAFVIPASAANPRYRLVIDIAKGQRIAAVSAPLRARKALPPIPHNFMRPSAKRPVNAKKVIVIDPGHGGVDPGAIGRSGIFEKTLTFMAARELQRQLTRDGRYKAVLTRNGDTFLRLRDRFAVARENRADLFISLHADTIRNKRVRGLSVYTLSENASDREAAELAEQENKSDLIAGVDLTHEPPEVTNILIDLAQRETMNESTRFARRLVGELKRVTKLLRNSHRFAGFAVLKAPDVPSVLIEMGFLSNSEDERALRRAEYRAQLARAVRRAVDRYFARVEQARGQ